LRELGENGSHLGHDTADDRQMLVGSREPGERLEEIGDPFSQVDPADVEDFEGVFGRVGDLLEAVEEDAVGQDVDLFSGDAAIYVSLAGVSRRYGEGVGGLVDGFFAGQVPRVVLGVFFDAPAKMLLLDEFGTVTNVGGTAVADELTALLLDANSGLETGAGDGDEGITGWDAAEGPLVKGERTGIAQLVVEPLVTDAAAMEEKLRDMQPGKGLNFVMGKTFALEPLPRKGRVDYGKMASPLQFACEFEVVEDAKDSLNDSHEGSKGEGLGRWYHVDCSGYEWGMDEGKALCGASVYIICVIRRNESGQALSMVLPVRSGKSLSF
jgi:hypothetical protein